MLLLELLGRHMIVQQEQHKKKLLEQHTMQQLGQEQVHYKMQVLLGRHKMWLQVEQQMPRNHLLPIAAEECKLEQLQQLGREQNIVLGRHHCS